MLTVTFTPAGPQLADREPQALGDVDGVRLRGAGQDDEDLLAADPVDRVAGTQVGAHRLGDLLQDRVAGGMAEPVVDALEVVEVAEQQGVGDARLAAGVAVEFGQALLQRVAVEEAGERIDGRAVPMGAVGLDQRAGEDHRADHERQGGDDRLVMLAEAAGSRRSR